MNECTTPSGERIAVGQVYRDAREVHVRTLRVDGIDVDRYDHVRVTCTVIRQEDGGEVKEPMRPTTMAPSRLASRAFQLLEDIK
ncbi:hypothetical protein RQCS_41110 [Rhodococcus qingshengii]|uniref:hypothetical protein n=1 Tax=Rhodococcus qingshengii TaxID=334542 RepID=UPI0007E5405E|nr:hypothetical protein [Rhodococcus qingshengii]BCF84566.1 hypothetical protein RQCS_41110 [Rhodococcus qingshengii]